MFVKAYLFIACSTTLYSSLLLYSFTKINNKAFKSSSLPNFSTCPHFLHFPPFPHFPNLSHFSHLCRSLSKEMLRVKYASFVYAWTAQFYLKNKFLVNINFCLYILVINRKRVIFAIVKLIVNINLNVCWTYP